MKKAHIQCIIVLYAAFLLWPSIFLYNDSVQIPKKFHTDYSRFTLSLLLLTTFANILDPDQNRHNVGPDLDPNHLPL